MMMVMMIYVATIYVASEEDDDDGDIASSREALSIVTKKPLDSLKFSIRKRQWRITSSDLNKLRGKGS